MPPLLTMRSTTASPPFHAATTGRGRPGPGTSASGLTLPEIEGAEALEEPAPADAPGTRVGLAVPAEDEPGVAVPVAEAAVGEVGVEEEAEPFFFMFIMKKTPTSRIRTPITATWTIGLLLIACLIRPPARSRSRAGPWRRASA